MASYDGSLKFDTKIDTQGFNNGTKDLSGQMKGLVTSIKAVGAAIAGSFVVKGIKSTIDAAEELQNAMTGLKSIMDGQGKSFSNAQKFINEYIADGLIPANNAITAYKNLALRGYDTSQIEAVLTALKDSATYGRQSAYTLGEAVQTASEGLKNENSILVDNAGVTKNVAKMWDDYAKSIGKSSVNLTTQEKIQAEVNGILEETKFQTGDAATYANSYSGQIARLNQQWLTFKQTMGNAFMTLAQAVLPILNNIMGTLIKFAKVFANVIKILFGGSTEISTSTDKIQQSASGASSAITSVGDAAETAGEQIDEALAPFDDLNVLQQDIASSGSGAGGVISSGGVGDVGDLGLGDLSYMEEFDEEIDRLTQKVLDFFGITVDEAGKVSWSFKDMSTEAKILSGILLYLAGKKVLGLLSGALGGISGLFSAITGSKIGQFILTKLAIPFKEFGALVSGVAGGTFTFKEAIGLAASSLGQFALNVGAVLAPLIAVGTAIWGVFEVSAGGIDKAVEKADLFGDVSDQTRKKVEPFIETLQDLGTNIKLVEFKDIVSDEDVASIKANTAEIANTLETELADKYTELQQRMSDANLFSNPEKTQEYMTMLNDGLAQQQGLVSYYQNEINKIYETASNEHRNLTQDEQIAVNEIQKQMGLNGLQILSDNDKEALSLKAKFNENYGVLTAQQVADAIAQAKELKDKTIEEANQEYDERIALAEELKATVPTFTDEMYNEMIESAKTARDEQIQSANDTYDEITRKAQETYPEITQFIDLETGKQLSSFEITKRAYLEGIEYLKNKAKEIFQQIVDWIGQKWEDIKNSAKSALNYVIDIVNRMIDGINGVQFSVPDWVPGIGGGNFSLNIPKIPRLATGAVIPPNNEFVAVLGDQKNGRNLEAPEDLIRQIVREEAGSNSNRPIYLNVEVSGKTLLNILAEEETEQVRASGYKTGGGSIVY